MITKKFLETPENENKSIDCENLNGNYYACLYEAAGVNKEMLDLEIKYKEQEAKCDPESINGSPRFLSKPCTSNCTGVPFPFGILCLFKFSTKLSPRKFDDIDLCDHKCLTIHTLKGYRNCLMKCNKKVYEAVIGGEYREEGYEYEGNDFSKKTKGNKGGSLSAGDSEIDPFLLGDDSSSTVDDSSSYDVVSGAKLFKPEAALLVAILMSSPTI
ncbi:hypothetical protein CONCODRAFT_9256 [Conidiobolus coronatus NRRL 28638]|uniref:Uncharacterized protein n=1 Tax=Conidiobolus coronatus (strain ATCC 28846 / CBS 209.66 / NRRL 28638) TaxID=796925 RepID=A0A137P0T8_CONC2|nr:hypothetical protein CONCODRAFT_9256 [Conidiobolus coronatus NRRL 28638]|eukprot:KXN68494.1 hypothetical protein CONCODRAFT_9256 [Conidiobolus coronatus NRRL 28638]